MKKNFLTAVILMSICLVCAALISGINIITAPMITQNDEKKEATLCKKIFAEYSTAKETILEDFASSKIIKLVIAADSSSNTLGYIYTVSGKNAYGTITLLVGIDTNKELVSVEFMENGQSFSSETANHVSDNYLGGITIDDVNGIDTVCGATYGAKLVKELVTTAFVDAKTREVA